jgi:hypothetical protein
MQPSPKDTVEPDVDRARAVPGPVQIGSVVCGYVPVSIVVAVAAPSESGVTFRAVTWAASLSACG